MELVRTTAAWVMLGILTLAGGIILYRMATREINLAKLVSEQDGTASMARFQLLIFTFVVALSVFYVTVSPDSVGLPEIPAGILTLLGVSASSYGVGKLLQTQSGAQSRGKGGGDDVSADKSGENAAPVKAAEKAYKSQLEPKKEVKP